MAKKTKEQLAREEAEARAEVTKGGVEGRPEFSDPKIIRDITPGVKLPPRNTES